MPVDSSFFKNKKNKGLYFGLWFLVLVCVLTWALFFYNSTIEKQNDHILSQIQQTETSIKNERKDKNIAAYHVYNLNKEVFDNLSDKSQVSKFVEHALRTMVRYDLVFENFSLSGDEITLNVSAESNDKWLAYSKIIKFLNEYNKSETSLFTLEQVENFTGQDNIKFPIRFTIK